MSTVFYPLADRVLIKPDKLEEARSASGLIIIPSLGHERPTTGKVVAKGLSCRETFSIGDQVLFGKYAGNDIKLNEELLTICREDDILGIITEET